jgi:hypothetical protein
MIAVFGIDSSGLDLVVRLLILCLVVIWLALIYWTYSDAKLRMTDPMLIGCATAASLFPFVGTIVYTIVRPPEYLDDKHERELEMQAAAARLDEFDALHCPNCESAIEKDFLRCPACLRKLKDPCVACNRPLEPQWAICPYCETEVPGAIQPPPRTRRRRREEPSLADQPAPLETREF